jgi:molybdate transport system substrate-binding protein
VKIPPTCHPSEEIEMKHFAIILLTLMLILSACGTPTPAAIPAVSESQTLTVFAAASLTSAFGEMGKKFESANPGVKIAFNFGGSQTLRTQIEQGATADIFASANSNEMDALVTGKFIGAGTSKIFLTNQLLVIMPANNPARLKTLSELTKPGLKLVLAAKEVPVGNYSLQVLEKLETTLGAGFKDKVLTNVVSYENDVKQVVAKVQLGEADAGIVYLSDAVTAPELQKIEIPAENNIIAQYPIAVLYKSVHTGLAQSFIAYILSYEGQATLQKWGFLPVK